MKCLYHVRKVRSIDFSVFDYFSIGFWNYSDRVLFFVFPFLLCNRVVNWYGSKQKFQHCITLSSTRYSQHATFQKTNLCLILIDSGFISLGHKKWVLMTQGSHQSSLSHVTLEIFTMSRVTYELDPWPWTLIWK